MCRLLGSVVQAELLTLNRCIEVIFGDLECMLVIFLKESLRNSLFQID